MFDGIKSLLNRERVFFINLLGSSLLPVIQLVLYFLYDNDVYGKYILFMALVQVQNPLINLKYEFNFNNDHLGNVKIIESIRKHLFGNFFVVLILEFLVFNQLFEYDLVESVVGVFAVLCVPIYLLYCYYLMFSGNTKQFFFFKMAMPAFFLLFVCLDLFVVDLGGSLIFFAFLAHTVPFLVLVMLERKHLLSIWPRFQDFRLFQFSVIRERWRYLSAGLLDNLSLYFPVFVISKFFAFDIVGQFGYITKILVFPQVFLAQPISAHIQISFAKKNLRFIGKIFGLSIAAIFVYLVLFSGISWLLRDLIEKYVEMLSGGAFYVLFAVILSYSLKVVVNPISVILYVNNDGRRLQLSQLVLFFGEVVASILAFVLTDEYYEYLLIQSLVATASYMFYYINIIASLKKAQLNVAKEADDHLKTAEIGSSD